MRPSREASDMRVKNRASEVPALPNTARVAAGELMPTLHRIAADALTVHDYFATHGEPLEGLSPARYAEMLVRIQAAIRPRKPPPSRRWCGCSPMPSTG